MKTILAPMALSLVGLCVVATAASGQESANYVAKLMGLSLAGAEPQEKDNLEPTLAAAFAKQKCEFNIRENTTAGRPATTSPSK